MKTTGDNRDRVLEVRCQFSGLHVVKPDMARPVSVTPHLHYGYLARLLDDGELSLIEDSGIRAATRAVHRQVYWKSLQLLSRDVSKILVHRRKLMEARGEWRFEDLIAESYQIWKLLWTLRIAGVAQGIHVPVMAAAARAACGELSRLMVPVPVFSSPAIHAL